MKRLFKRLIKLLFRRRLFLLPIFVFYIFTPSILFAAGATPRIENGIEVYTYEDPASFSKIAYFFDSYVWTTTEVYNDVGSTTANSGVINIRDILDERTVLVNVSNIGNNGTLTVSINGFIGTVSTNVGTPSASYTYTIGTVTSQLIPITEYFPFMNIGCVTSTGTITGSVKFIGGTKR